MTARRRKVAAVVGAAALAGGILSLLGARGVVSGMTAVLYLGGAGLGAVTTYYVYRDWTSTRAVDPPAVERAVEHPSPGERFDRLLAQFDGNGRGHLPDRKAIHDRLRYLAAQILARRRGYTFEDARVAVEAGEWPDDPDVAGFLRDPDANVDRSWREHLRAVAGREDGPSDFQRLAGRTVDALAARSTVGDFGADAESSVVSLDRATGTDGPRTTRRPSDDGSTPASGGAGPVVEEVATGRWRVVVPVAVAFVGFGFALREAVVVLAGTVAFGFAVYAEAFGPGTVEPVVERSIDTDDPAPGDVVEVTTTVRNEGDRVLPDLVVIDGVPEGLAVTEGSPRHGTALRSGESTSFTYAVTARRGVHEFGPAYVVGRGYASATERTCLVAPTEGSDASLSCVPSWDPLPVPVPLYEQAGDYLGRLPAGGGEGIEFHSTREYRSGDSMARIDWKHLARSADDELTTVRFREERAATVALVIDTYPVAYLANSPEDSGAVEHSIEAAAKLFDSLLDGGDRIGVAALGGTPLWLAPDAGVDHRKRVTELLATDPAFPPTGSGNEEYRPRWVREFHRRFPAETQVILLSPLCDDRYPFLIRQLQGFGHPVTIVSPDPTVDGTVGQRLLRLERRIRIETLREAGVRVVDWNPSESLGVALGRATGRWSG